MTRPKEESEMERKRMKREERWKGGGRRKRRRRGRRRTGSGKRKVTFMVAMKAPEVARNNVLLFHIKDSSTTCNKTDTELQRLRATEKRKQTTLPDWLNKQIIIMKSKIIFDVDI